MQFSIWHQIPIIRILIPFICGIGLSMFFPLPLWLSGVLFSFALLASLAIMNWLKQYAYRWVFGFSINITLFIGGMLLHQAQNELLSVHHFQNSASAQYLVIQLDETPVSKLTTYKIKSAVLATINKDGKTNVCSGKLILYVQKLNWASYKYGDVLVIPYNRVRLLDAPKNPDEFNYKRYLAFNQIHHQVYVSNKDIINSHQNKGNKIQLWIIKVQQYFKDVLSRCIASANETGVAQALLYGYDDDIDAETMQAYANTGTLHVLAVSGMHVGIIFTLLGYFLFPLNKTYQLRLLKNVIILVMLWLYSLLCGMSPSILRATVMFSFIIVADCFKAKSNVYNTLAASAFVLLCFDSNMLANVGFQLSYLAVIGIVFFQPLIANWYSPSHWVTEQIWTITAVSLAAQLVTFPIGLLYFHQFPNCFLFSNLIIIPLTTIILYLGMILLAVSSFSWLSWIIGQTLFYSIQFTNGIVTWVEAIPFSYVNGLVIDIYQTLLLYFMLGCFTAYFLTKQKLLFKLSLGLLLLFCFSSTWHQFKNASQSRLIIYSIHKHTVLQFFDGHESTLIADSSFLVNPQKIKFHIQQHNWRSGIQQPQKIVLKAENKLYRHQQFTVFQSGKYLSDTTIKCNLLLITQPISIDSLLSKVTPEQVVISSAIPPTIAEKMAEKFALKQIPFTNLVKEPAFSIDFND